jgi:KDO2-lipid IV(A) lauroyltransferase
MHLVSRLLYYGFIVPLSLLPFWILYRISDGVYLIFYYLVGYRKKVVKSNLANSFPEKTAAERAIIEKKFYRHFCDLVVESLKGFTMSKEAARRRIHFRGLDVMDNFYDQGRSVILVSAHYGNWEMGAVALGSVAKHQVIAIYQPLTNRYLDKKMLISRTRYGLDVMETRMVKEEFEKRKSTLMAPGFLIDQAPRRDSKSHWMTFLEQETAVLTGAERYAVAYNYPVLYVHGEKLKRGHYRYSIELVSDEPVKTKPGEITEKTNRILEEEIRKCPELWLWTHRKWKHSKLRQS